ncbi:MAG: flagellar hook-length control protein FliK [Planctomycetes bacterium]|nr:flagellar hook-length control protein FliK [Planctomycetota bacterium]
MIVTKFGRIGADPLLVPTAASMQTGSSTSFAEHLDQAAGEIVDDAPQAAAPADAEPATVPSEATVAGDPPMQDVADAIPTAATPTTTGDDARPVALTQGDASTIHRREEPGRHLDAGKGTDSSRASAFAPAATPAGQPGPALTAKPPGNTALSGIQTAGPSAAAALRDGPHGLRGIDLPASAKSALARAAAAQAGFRTANVHTAQMLEQARDSVFKQILFKLGNEGSEMRMRLEPPELGELELRMVVEKNGQMQLWIGAERPELVQMLQRNLQELERTLQQHGLAVTHAEVFAQGDPRGGPQREAPGDQGATAHDDETAAPVQPPARTGWITAQGLDFWV